MAQPFPAGGGGGPNADRKDEASFRAQGRMMWRAFVGSPTRNLLALLCLGLFSTIVATAFGQVLLNGWNKPFYDAIEKRDMGEFLRQLVVFAQIAGGLLVLNVAQGWLNQLLHIKLRQGLVRDLFEEWMRPERALRLARSGYIGVNPDQRLHEDARHFADLSVDLGIGLVQSTVLLVSFIGVLWSISAGFSFHFGGRVFDIPGYMVWAALAYAGTGSWLSWLLGRRLIRLNSERYAREAAMRSALMRVNSELEAITAAHREADARRSLNLDLDAVLTAARRIMSASVRLSWFTTGYGWITVVAPIVIASPVYFAGDISFGGLMMAAAAFTQVHSALRWFIDNTGGIADWRSTLTRVASFRLALVKLAEADAP